MAKNFGGKGGAKLPQRGREAKHEQFGRQPKELVLCPECQNVKFEKHWHAPEKARGLEHFKNQKGLLKRELCPACRMIANHTFEGEVFIENFPQKFQTELLNLINAFGKRATERDPQDRLIALEQIPTGIRVTTTEDETAVKLARKVQDAFKTVDLAVSYSSEPQEVSRVHVEYLEREIKNIKNARKSRKK